MLATKIARCHSKEAAKKYHTDIITENIDMVAALCKPHPPAQQDKPSSYPGYGGTYHKGGHSCVQPLIRRVCFAIRLGFL